MGGKGHDRNLTYYIITQETMIPQFTRSTALAATLVSLPHLALSQQFPGIAPEIVSAWKANSAEVVVVFNYDGSYHHIQGGTADPAMERGTFTWDKTTQAFTTQPYIDTSGSAGFSFPAAGPLNTSSITISGNTLNYTPNGNAPIAFTRIVNTVNAIVGSWKIPGEKFSVTFLADGSYYLADEANDVPSGYTGMEKGTFTWNSTSKAFTATPTIDTNGDVGFSSLSGATVNITSNSLVIAADGESTTLVRIVTSASPLNLPDFGTVRFANYLQTSNATPALAPYDLGIDSAPYSAEAFVDPAVGATAPTLKIGNSNPIVLDDEGGGSFSIEEPFSSSSALNAFLPASTALQFKDGTATPTANLTTSSSLTFPSIPKINLRSGDSWSGGVYRFGEDEVLQWTLPSGFTSSEYITILNVYDPLDDQDVVDAELQGEVTHFDLNGKLQPGREYEIELEFFRIDGSTTSGEGVFTGNLGYILSASSTSFTVAALPTTEAPVITGQPGSQLGTPNAPLTLTVGINDAAFPTTDFQWLRNGEPIPGQSANSLYIPNFDFDVHSGRYTVIAINQLGTAESQPFNLGKVGTQNQHVQRLSLSKRLISEQQSATLLTPIGATFDARIEGVGLSTTFPSSSNSITKLLGATTPLVFDDDHWDVERDFADFTAMQTAFPNGSYVLQAGADSVSLRFIGNNYPNQPLVSSSVGTWVNGKLQVTAAQAAAGFTLTSNTTTGDGFATLAIINSNDDEILYAEANTTPVAPDFITATISPNQLSLGQTYEVEVEFDQVNEFTQLTNRTWALPPEGNAQAFSLQSSTSVLKIEIIPNPSGNPYTTWQASFFTPAQLANPAIGGDTADFDKDGIPTLLEYLLGGNPTLPNSGLLPTITKAPGSSNVLFTYKRKIAATGVTQVIEHAMSLSPPWTPAVHGASGVTIITAAIPGDATAEQVIVTIPSTSASRFVRLKVSR